MVLCLKETPHSCPWMLSAESQPAAGLCPVGLLPWDQVPALLRMSENFRAGGLPLPSEWELGPGLHLPHQDQELLRTRTLSPLSD